MCGIIGYVGKQKRTLKDLIKGLYNLEYRGYDSAGIAYLKDKKLVIEKRVGRIKELEQAVDGDIMTDTLIGHTRWATHGQPTVENAHPHKVGKITIVHNGIIENYEALKHELEDSGYHFASETDTEVACGELDYLYNKTGNMLKAISLFMDKVIGSYAICMMNEDELDNLYVIKRGSPLIIGVTSSGNFVGSDILAVINNTRKYIVLDDGMYGVITAKNVTIYNKEHKKIRPIIKEVSANIGDVNKNGYDHYMLKEIHEEPSIVRNNTSKYEIPDIRIYKKIIIVGCGSAMHAGLIGKSLIETYGGIPVSVEIASEFRYKKLFLDKDTLVIAISQSGETADTLEAVTISKKYGSYTLGIVNVVDSSIAREVDSVIYTNAGSEIAVATTKAYIAQVMVLILLASKILKLNGENVANFNKELKKLPVVMEELITSSKYKSVAKKLYKHNDIFYIGRNIDYAVCMEGSLKLKEIAYIHSEAYAAGELKHGTISLIEEGMPVIGVVSEAGIASKTISNLEEVKARGAYVVYITTSEFDMAGKFYDMKIVLPTVDKLLQPIINIIPLQLIAYYTAKLRKCDIDKPKNLAKSVTVE